MRQYYKTCCLRKLAELESIHNRLIKIITFASIDEIAPLLEECQSKAIYIGNTIDESEGEDTDVVKDLEDYCEFLYQIYENKLKQEKINSGHIKKHLKKVVVSTRKAINIFPSQLEIVFLPYKASMWDSLESIWMAANEDAQCTSLVIPVPYYDKKPDGGILKLHYEGDLFPEYVPITKYSDYDIEERHPDIIFIHNPYDGYNLVTSVHPNYYTARLKEYTDCLVYSPYYSVAGQMEEGQRYLPSYENMDYLIAQSDEIKAQYDKRVPREKILAFGTPKFDRVIRLSLNPPELPVEWKKIAKGRRIIFFNTSLGGLLENTEAFLKKMEFVFEYFKNSEKACLLWRPHPLMEATMQSMRQEYISEFQRLKNMYLEGGFGIYDDSDDIEVTIALSDALIGDHKSSITSLFSVAGKPIFILDNYIHEIVAKDAWKGWIFIFPTMEDRFNKYMVMPQNKLFWSPENNLDYKYLCDLANDSDDREYVMACEWDNKAYVFPANAQDILIVSNEGGIDRIPLKQLVYGPKAFDRVWIFGNQDIGGYAFLIPDRYPHLVRYNFSTGELDYVKNVSEYFWHKDCGEHILSAGGMSGLRRELFLLNATGDELLVINVDTLEQKRITVDIGQTMVVVLPEDIKEDRYYWFLPYKGTIAVRWDSTNNSTEEFDLYIDGLCSYDWGTKSKTDRFYFHCMASLGEEIIFGPNWANKFVLLNKKNGEVREWLPPFKLYTEDVGYYYRNWGRGWFVWDLSGNAVRYANAPERITYDIDIDNNTAKPVKVNISEPDAAMQYAKGFWDVDGTQPYYCYETPWNTLDNFVSGEIRGESFDRQHQRKSFARYNANFDGNCGEHIYGYLKDKMV